MVAPPFFFANEKSNLDIGSYRQKHLIIQIQRYEVIALNSIETIEFYVILHFSLNLDDET
jgi:hypothetical protein